MIDRRLPHGARLPAPDSSRRPSRPGAGQAQILLEQAGRGASLTGHAGVVLAAGSGWAPRWRPGQAGLGFFGHERACPAGAVGLPRGRAALPAVIRCCARCRDRRRREAARPGPLIRLRTGDRRRSGNGAAGTRGPGGGQSQLPGLQRAARVGTRDLRRDPRQARAIRPEPRSRCVCGLAAISSPSRSASGIWPA